MATLPVEEPKKEEPPKEEPAPQSVAVSTEVICGPHDPAKIYNLIRAEGVPRISAIQLLGSWKSESGGGFDQCQKRGDGGIAWGLNSWHPGRRYDMPQQLEAQVKWAISTEMRRDCASCYQQFMNATTAWEARSAIQKSTRWGVEGARWTYANEFESIF